MAEQANSYPVWVRDHPPPCLETMVRKWGGYWSIPDEAWRRFQEEMRRWQDARRDRWLR